MIAEEPQHLIAGLRHGQQQVHEHEDVEVADDDCEQQRGSSITIIVERAAPQQTGDRDDKTSGVDEEQFVALHERGPLAHHEVAVEAHVHERPRQQQRRDRERPVVRSRATLGSGYREAELKVGSSRKR